MPEDPKKLRFYARGADLVYVPGHRPMAGGICHYIGRAFVQAERDPNGNVTKAGRHPAVKDAFEVLLDSPNGQALLLDMQRAVMRGDANETANGIHRLPLWPADKETAELLGVPHVDVKFVDGEWVDPDADRKLDALKGRKAKPDGKPDGKGDKTKPLTT